ncbi:MAG: ImmA/IrrE family metallo-endopeptidase [Bryocella sp.]
MTGLSAKAEANGISKLLTAVFGSERFPVDVEKLALEYTRQRFPDSYVSQIKRMDIRGFEGCLQANKDGSRWLIAYSAAHGSPGRMRFTLAHELGHFMLHRETQPLFECTERDMYDWDSPARAMEAEADTFASYVLMPLDDFRRQLGSQAMCLEFLEHSRVRYGVSRMAAALKWIEIAPRRALVVAARDGHLLWARMNRAAYKSGAFLATRKKVVEIPSASLLKDVEEGGEKTTATKDARIWFPKEPSGTHLHEIAIRVEGPYPYVLGILMMPDALRPWELSDEEDDEPGLTAPTW